VDREPSRRLLQVRAIAAMQAPRHSRLHWLRIHDQDVHGSNAVLGGGRGKVTESQCDSGQSRHVCSAAQRNANQRNQTKQRNTCQVVSAPTMRPCIAKKTFQDGTNAAIAASTTAVYHNAVHGMHLSCRACHGLCGKKQVGQRSTSTTTMRKTHTQEPSSREAMLSDPVR